MSGSSAEPTTSIGIVLAGGGSFGAFEAGVLQSFFDQWMNEHGTAPRISVIAGTSTGALLGSFVALGPEGVKEIAHLDQHIRRPDVFGLRPTVLLPFALFTRWSSSIYTSDPLRTLLNDRLPDDRLRRIAALWPETRFIVQATDLGSGWPVSYSNAPEDAAQGFDWMRAGILASASTPSTTAPVYMQSERTQRVEPHMDGAIGEFAPIRAMFAMAAKAPTLHLTQVIVIAPYPLYPGSDANPAQRRSFPAKPNFGEIASRAGALNAESTISTEIALAWAAISLRKAGVSAEVVQERTGFYIPVTPSEFIIITPESRLGWDTLAFDPDDLEEMFRRGLMAKPRALIP